LRQPEQVATGGEHAGQQHRSQADGHPALNPGQREAPAQQAERFELNLATAEGRTMLSDGQRCITI